VQNAGAVLEWPANGHGGIELLQFGLQLLVDQQQRLQRAVQLATIASMAASFDLDIIENPPNIP
jgi:hypothetical protein